MPTIAPTLCPALPEAIAAPTLRTLLEEPFCLLALLRDGAWPREPAGFQARLEGLLALFRERALSQGKAVAPVDEATYAVCALADELLLAEASPLREAWARAPLQLKLFGDHLAGEGFYQRLDRLLRDPGPRGETLEVFHTCLLLGFKGKYLLEPAGTLQNLVARTAQELRRLRGEGAGLAPCAEPAVRPGQGPRAVPLWAWHAVLGAAALGLLLTFRLLLAHS
jgi:type VI secretion system protein ImpK